MNEPDDSGWTALHHTTLHLQTEAVEWLLDNGASTTAQSNEGSTGLHYAIQAASAGGRRQVEIVRSLLGKGADPTTENSHKRTPAHLAKTMNRQAIASLFEHTQLVKDLILAGGEATRPDAVALRFGGPPGAGKSTLTGALCVTRRKGRFRYESGADSGSINVHQRTKGINCQLFVDENSAKFSILDLGGHGEFLATHQTFIGAGTVPVIDGVVVSALDDDLENTVFKWCSLFASRNQPTDTPWPLILIATRADKASEAHTHQVLQVYAEVKQRFNEYFRLPFDEPFCIDARKSWSSLTIALRQALTKLHNELLKQDQSPRQPAICQNIVRHLPALRQETHPPVVTKDTFLNFMEARIGRRRGVLTPEETISWKNLMDKALRSLSGFTTVLSFSQPLAQDYVVIEPRWLLSDIVGRLMSEPPLPGPYIAYNNGYAEKKAVVKALDTKHLPGGAAFEMVANLGFCLEQRTTDEVLNPSKLCGYRRDEHWRRDASMVVNEGRRLKCKGIVAIANAFFPHLQVHFYHRYLTDYKEKLPMWSGGIRLVAGLRSSAEALIETNPANSYIDIIVRGELGSENDCAKLLFELTEETLQKAAELSPGSQLQLFYLSRMELDELSPEGLPSKPCVEYTEESVLHAVKHHLRITDGKASRKPEDPHSLLLWLPPAPLAPLSRSVSEQDWRIVLLQVAKAMNSFDECTCVAETLSVSDRGEDIVLQLRSQDPHRLPPEIAMKIFERWLRRGASQLATDERREVLHRLFHTAFFFGPTCGRSWRTSFVPDLITVSHRSRLMHNHKFAA